MKTKAPLSDLIARLEPLEDSKEFRRLIEDNLKDISRVAEDRAERLIEMALDAMAPFDANRENCRDKVRSFHAVAEALEDIQHVRDHPSQISFAQLKRINGGL